MSNTTLNMERIPMTSDTQNTAPERIWLQDAGDYTGAKQATWNSDTGVTWCEDQINDDDTGYVRDDLHTRVVAERDEALNQLDSALHSVDVLERRVAEAFRQGMLRAAEIARAHIYYDSAGTGFSEDEFEAAIRAEVEKVKGLCREQRRTR